MEAELTVNLVDDKYHLDVPSSLDITEGDSEGELRAFGLSDSTDVPVTVTITGMENTTLEVHPSTAVVSDGVALGNIRFSGAPDPDADDETITVWVNVSGGDYDDTPPHPIRVAITDLGEDRPRASSSRPLEAQSLPLVQRGHRTCHE